MDSENFNNIPANNVEISVIDYQLTNDSKFSKHTSYTVKGSDHLGNFEVQRRFKDFLALRNFLLLQWPGCYIPSLPGKKLFYGNDIKTINDRQQFLHAFCMKLSQLPYLYNCNEVVQLFLRSSEQQFYKLIDAKKQPAIEDILTRYQSTFHEIVDFTVDATLIKSIDDFADQIRNYSQKLKGIKRFVKQSVLQSKEYNKCLADIINIKLINYENHYISQFTKNQEHLLFFNHRKSTLQETYKQEEVFSQNNIEILLSLIRLESKDCKVMILFYNQVLLKQINDKVELENKVKGLESKIMDYERGLEKTSNGKKSLVNLIKQKSSETIKEELNTQINSAVKEIELTKNLILFIQKIIGLLEIKKYYLDKNQQFKDIMQALQQMELESINVEQQYWTHILNETSELITTQQQQQQQLDYENLVQQQEYQDEDSEINLRQVEPEQD